MYLYCMKGYMLPWKFYYRRSTYRKSIAIVKFPSDYNYNYDQDTKIEQNTNDISLLKKEIEKLKEENREILKILKTEVAYQI